MNRSLFLLYGILCLFACHPSESPNYDWAFYSSDAAGSKYAALDQINPQNVSQLEPAWIFRADDMRARPATTIECNPLIISGIMYLTTPGLKVVALNAATGQEKWRFDPYDGIEAGGVNRGVSYWSDGTEARIFYVAGSSLYSLDASNGKPIASFGDKGAVDLYEGLGRDVRHTWVTAATPGVVYKDLLILGTTLGEGPSPAAPGYIRAYDVRTGEMKWIFHTLPRPGETGYETWPEDAWQRIGGVNAWGGFTLDMERGWVFCGTGSAAYDHWGGDRIGANLFANCILALDASTGERIWHYQVVHHDIWDYDIPCPPNLVQVQQDGKTIDAVAQPTKMGHLFVLDRETGKPIFPVEEIAVPQSEIPGEESWPTQPFPPKSLRYAQQRFTAAEVAQTTPASTDSILERLKGMDTGDIFLPPSKRGAVTLPQFNGGTDWGGAAYDPETNMLYVNASNEAEWISMVESKPTTSFSSYELGERLYRSICSTCHGFGASKNPDSPSLADLRGIAQERGKAGVHTVLQNGKGQMPRFPMLSETERKGVISFLWEEGKDIQVNVENLSFAATIPYLATGHNVFKDPEGFPVNKGPWGTLSAIDLNKGAIKWQVPLGTYPELEARGMGMTGTFNMGGPLVTAGNLVFIGGSMDERFRAFDKRTGEMLWEFQLDAGAYATPSTFAVDGKQYVVIAAGGGGKPGTKPGNAYYCFALP